MRNGACFRLPKSARRTSASGYSASLLPTPAAQSYGTSQNGCPGDGREHYKGKGKPSLETMARRNLWPTPSASLGEHAGLVTPAKGREGGTLVEAVSARLWPTPTAGDAKGSGSKAHAGVSLTDAVKYGNSNTPRRFPTPTAQDASNNGASGQQRRNTKPLNAEIGGALNPAWVEWLMGFPLGWTAYELSATPSCPRKPPTPSDSSHAE